MHRVFIYMISIVSVSLLGGFFDVSYAASGKTETGTVYTKEDTPSTETSAIEKKTPTGSGKVEEKTEDNTIDSEEEEKIKQDINSYIIESYKAQWTKIIKDLSIKLTKTVPDIEERKEAYKKIQSSLELRKKKTEKVKMSDTKKLILTEFLDHMIDLLDTKINELDA